MRDVPVSVPPEEEERARNARFASGQITEDEIRAHWANPEAPLFEHEIVHTDREGHERRTLINVRALTEDLKEPLLEEVRSAWDTDSFEELQQTLESFFAQKKLGHPLLSNVEYYVATDAEGRPIAITGIYTVDIQGGAGFATRDRLNPAQHHLTARLGWFSVSKRYQGSGVGGYLLDWTEKMAKSRGAAFMAIETDDAEEQETARKLYESRGYEAGFSVKDYFGPGRDLVTYVTNVENEEGLEPFIPDEAITRENRDEILALARRVYSPARFDEFEVCLDLFLRQAEGQASIKRPKSIVLRNPEGRVESFALLAETIYEGNAMTAYWDGADPQVVGSKARLVTAMKGLAKREGRGVLVLSREGEDEEYLHLGFQKPEKGIPEVFGKGDRTNALLYTKRLRG